MNLRRLLTAMFWALCLMVAGCFLVSLVWLFVVSPGVIQVLIAGAVSFLWLTFVCYQIVKDNGR